MNIRGAYPFLLVVLGLLGVGGCAFPERNVQLDQIDYEAGYRWTQVERNSLDRTLVIVTASGGGTRAAALTLGTLRAIDNVEIPGADGTLLDEVDLISSVSGGSVTAAFFALKGRNGFEKLERDFLRQDGIGTLLWQGANPFGLAQLSLPSYERIDLLVDYLGETLFEGATFRDLLDSDVGTYLILNATDMTDGAVFPFTQSQFDLLCSDLAQTRLSEAVAASAAFPVALSPITLKNFSPCPAQQTATAWPPGWIESGLETVWYTNESRVRRARLAASYLNQTAEKNFVHLLDGGISDNLAVAEPFRLLTTFEVSPQFLTDISRGRIDRVVFVLINARSVPGSILDLEPDTPGAFEMLNATINSAIDNASFSTVDKVRGFLTEQLNNIAPDMPPPIRERLERLETNFIRIDFEAIPDGDCRRKFQQIATSWTLADPEIDALLDVSGALLAQDPEFADLLDVLGAVKPELPSMKESCDILSGD